MWVRHSDNDCNVEAEMARNRIKELRAKDNQRKWDEFLQN